MFLLAFGIGTQEVIIILIIIIVLFGATKLPQLGTAIGQGLKNFKRGMREVQAEDEEAARLKAQKDALADSGKSSEDINESHKA
ncbi:MAG: twin-arginine translocase TatA/TatE family subunit [Bradymonadia bacterium]